MLNFKNYKIKILFFYLKDKIIKHFFLLDYNTKIITNPKPISLFYFLLLPKISDCFKTHNSLFQNSRNRSSCKIRFHLLFFTFASYNLKAQTD